MLVNFLFPSVVFRSRIGDKCIIQYNVDSFISRALQINSGIQEKKNAQNMFLFCAHTWIATFLAPLIRCLCSTNSCCIATVLLVRTGFNIKSERSFHIPFYSTLPQPCYTPRRPQKIRSLPILVPFIPLSRQGLGKRRQPTPESGMPVGQGCLLK